MADFGESGGGVRGKVKTERRGAIERKRENPKPAALLCSFPSMRIMISSPGPKAADTSQVSAFLCVAGDTKEMGNDVNQGGKKKANENED